MANEQEDPTVTLKEPAICAYRECGEEIPEGPAYRWNSDSGGFLGHTHIDCHEGFSVGRAAFGMASFGNRVSLKYDIDAEPVDAASL